MKYYNYVLINVDSLKWRHAPIKLGLLQTLQSFMRVIVSPLGFKLRKSYGQTCVHRVSKLQKHHGFPKFF